MGRWRRWKEARLRGERQEREVGGEKVEKGRRNTSDEARGETEGNGTRWGQAKAKAVEWKGRGGVELRHRKMAGEKRFVLETRFVVAKRVEEGEGQTGSLALVDASYYAQNG